MVCTVVLLTPLVFLCPHLMPLLDASRGIGNPPPFSPTLSAPLQLGLKLGDVGEDKLSTVRHLEREGQGESTDPGP